MSAIQDIELTTIEGRDASLADYDGQVLLVVNTASQCGLTPQYAGLEALFERYRDEGFAVLGFPANDFGAQEPGTDEEIASFCTTSFGVEFPMFAKVQATGPGKHPLYAALIEALPASPSADAMRARLEASGRTANPAPELLWNFEKFLIGRDGEPVARFSPDTKPDDPALVSAIERELFASE